ESFEGCLADHRLIPPMTVITNAPVNWKFWAIAGDDVSQSSNMTAIHAYGYSTMATANAKRKAVLTLFSSPSRRTKILSVPGGMEPTKLKTKPTKKPAQSFLSEFVSHACELCQQSCGCICCRCPTFECGRKRRVHTGLVNPDLVTCHAACSWFSYMPSPATSCSPTAISFAGTHCISSSKSSWGSLTSIQSTRSP